MDIFTRTDLKFLLDYQGSPCVSLFLPTHRGGSPQDPIRWKNLLGQAEERLVADGMRGPATRDFLAPARRLLEDEGFWRGQSDGLAAFLAPKFLRFYRLPMTFPEQVNVSAGFRLVPLLPLLTNDGRFFVLALSQKQVRLLQGTAHSVQEIDLTKVPKGLAEALRFHDTDNVLTYHTVTNRPRGTSTAFYHGHGVGIDDHKEELLAYFRQVDKGLHEVLRNERVPLVLASVEYLWPLYREANRYPHLVTEGIAGNPDDLSASELHRRAWALIQPNGRQGQARAAALYAQLAGTGRTSAELREVVEGARQGRVEILFVERGLQKWGKMESATIHERQEAGDEDLINRAVVETLRHDGTVYTIEPGEVPGVNSAAALFWLPSRR
jgi:hypothetical protein